MDAGVAEPAVSQHLFVPAEVTGCSRELAVGEPSVLHLGDSTSHPSRRRICTRGVGLPNAAAARPGPNSQYALSATAGRSIQWNAEPIVISRYQPGGPGVALGGLGLPT